MRPTTSGAYYSESRLPRGWDGIYGVRGAGYHADALQRYLAPQTWASVPGGFRDEGRLQIIRRAITAVGDGGDCSGVLTHGRQLDPGGALLVAGALLCGEPDLARRFLSTGPITGGAYPPEFAMEAALKADEPDIAIQIFASMPDKRRRTGPAPMLCAQLGTADLVRALRGEGMPPFDRELRAVFIAVRNRTDEEASSLLAAFCEGGQSIKRTRAVEAALEYAAVTGGHRCFSHLASRVSGGLLEREQVRYLTHAAESGSVESFEIIDRALGRPEIGGRDKAIMCAVAAVNGTGLVRRREMVAHLERRLDGFGALGSAPFTALSPSRSMSSSGTHLLAERGMSMEGLAPFIRACIAMHSLGDPLGSLEPYSEEDLNRCAKALTVDDEDLRDRLYAHRARKQSSGRLAARRGAAALHGEARPTAL